MVKSNKSSKKSKGPIVDWTTYPPDVTEISNPNFYFGSDKFVFKNGDTYVGNFCAHICGLVWREGYGTYKTKDGHSYIGTWENDQLLNSETTKIIYPDGTKYEGSMQLSKYSGVGTYIPIRDVYITCTYEANKPTGEVELLDPNQNLWKGQVTNEEEILFLPVNHFYTHLSYDKGIGKPIIVQEQPQEDICLSIEASKAPSLDSQKLKELVFKKSEKTVNDFKKDLFEEKFLTSYDFPKMDEEAIIPKSKYSLKKARSGSNKSLLEIFWSKEFRNSCEPIKVIYPNPVKETSEVGIQKGSESETSEDLKEKELENNI